ncbi:MAG: ABC transporter substrate-binding protein [bacterium]
MFKFLRRYYWITKSFFARHYSIVLRTTILVLAVFALFFFFARYFPTTKHTLRLGRIGKYTLVDFPLDVQTKISSGLVTVDQDGNVKPGLAKTWQVQDEGKTYLFTLDQDLVWHNGTPVVAEDITYNFKDVQVERGDNTITYRLKESFAPFFSAVSRPILKKDKLGTKAYRLTKTQIGNGVIQSLQIENETERLIYKFYPTESSALTAYKLGDVDIIEGLSYVSQSISADATTQVQNDQTTQNRQGVLFFNNNDLLLSSKSTRQALAYAIEDKTFGKERSLSPIDKSSWAYNNLIKTYDFDEAKAKSLFAQDNPNPSSVNLEIKTILQYLNVAESIAESWQKILGIQVNVKVVSNMMNGDYQTMLADFTAPVDPDQYTIWHSTQATNFTHFSDLKIDKLLEDGRRTSDLQLRKELYQDFQRFLLEDCPAVFLFKSNSFTLSRKPLF